MLIIVIIYDSIGIINIRAEKKIGIKIFHVPPFEQTECMSSFENFHSKS